MMRFFAQILLFGSCGLLIGCVATYKQNDLAIPREKLDRSKTIMIAVPADGEYGGKPYLGSGRSTSLAVRGAFAGFANSTAINDACQDLPCLVSGSQSIVGYYVVPEILHWEDRATEWSGIPDSIEVKVSVYESVSGRELAATVISGKSKWSTFGGDHPQDLLLEPLKNYVTSLY